jgi:ferredoxin-like protein FixX
MAFTILRTFYEEYEENRIQLIVKNQEKTIDHRISNLIRSFLDRRKENTQRTHAVLIMINALINDENVGKLNCVKFTKAAKIPEALVKILIKEKEKKHVIQICLELVAILVMYHCNDEIDIRAVTRNFVECGVCEISIMEIYVFDEGEMIEMCLHSIYNIIEYGSNVRRCVEAGLFKALVHVFNSLNNSPIGHNELCTPLVQRLCGYNDDFVE